jgi:hypothetical protein
MRHSILFATALSLSLVAGCTDDDLAATDLAVAGTPDELALLRFVNDASTTVDVLDVQVMLDSRAAKNIIAHRDGGDRFDSIDEVDAIAYVGPAALDKLVAFARAGGWVHDDELFGTFDGVSFTVAEARAAITLVNTATDATLRDTVKLDSRAVRSIVDARPVLTMAELADLYYVGNAMMTRIRTIRLGYSNESVPVEALRRYLVENLTDIRVYEVGLIQVHDYIVGVSRCGGLVGVTAISIET